MISVYKDFDDVPKGLENGDLTEAKKRLREIYYGKCAYTEQKISEEETYILRYRPVSEYPWLEFEWSNLLPVCKMIFERLQNKPFKIEGKKVKKAPENREDFKADSELMLSEESLLLHPEVDTIENYMSFTDINGIVIGYSEKGTNTIDLCDLNNLELQKKRKDLFVEIFEKLELIKNRNYSENDIKPFLFNLKDNSKMESSFSSIYRTIIEYFDGFLARFNFDESRFSDYADFYLYDENAYICDSLSLLFALKKIVIKKYNSIKNITIEDIPVDAHWLFFTGENGFGKTLLLQSIFIGVHGNRNRNFNLNIDTRFVTEFTFSYPKSHVPQFKHYINSVGGIDREGLPSSFQEAFVAYGANRLNISGYVNEDEKTQAPQKTSKSNSLFGGNGTLYNIEAYLTKMHGREQYAQRIESIKKILIDLLPSVAVIEIDDSEVDKKVYYREKAENGDLLNRIRFHQLSAGNKSIIAMVGDMLTEFYEGQPNVESPSDFIGIVLIDEIDAHLHPKWQRELVVKLTKLFPKVQFIASTHSPIPLLGAPKETVIFNVEKPDKKTGIQVRRLNIDVSQLTPNTILTSPIFGFDDIISESHDKEEKLYTQDSYNEVVFEKMLHEKLDNLAKEGGKSLEELLEL